MWKRIAGRLGVWRALLGVERGCGWRRQLVVVTYHHVAVAAPPLPPLSGLQTGIDPALFAAQIQALCRWYRPLDMPACQAIAAGQQPLREDSFVVTFDDAYASVAELAMPILEPLGIRPHLFVATGFIDSPHRFWWVRAVEAMRQVAPELWSSWRANSAALPAAFRPVVDRRELEDVRARRAACQHLLAVLDDMPLDEQAALLDWLEQRVPPPVRSELPLLSWDELRAGTPGRWTIGAHTHWHPRLGRLTLEATAQDLAISNAVFREQLGAPPSTFAYPQGDFHEHSHEALAPAGIDAAFTTRHGFLRGAAPDRWHLPRTCLGSRSGPDLAARLALIKGQKYFSSLLKRAGRRAPAGGESS